MALCKCQRTDETDLLYFFFVNVIRNLYAFTIAIIKHLPHNNAFYQNEISSNKIFMHIYRAPQNTLRHCISVAAAFNAPRRGVSTAQVV